MTELIELIRRVVRAEISGINTALPGQIEAWDYTTRKADVKPTIKRRLVDGTLEALPVIVNVPVIFPCSGSASITFPLQKGDPVLLVFSARPLENWLSLGGDADPGDQRKFDLSDAIAIPGVNPFSTPSPAETADELMLKLGEAKIKLQAGGKLAMGSDGNELLDLVISALNIFLSHTNGGLAFDQSVSLQPVIDSLNSIKGSL